MELIFGAGKIDRRVSDVEELLRDRASMRGIAVSTQADRSLANCDDRAAARMRKQAPDGD
jgi:hypothetical protein